jgi:hypothetical protein
VSSRARRLVAATAVAAAVLGSGLYAGKAAATTTPDTFHTCTTGSSSGNVNTCLNVNGSGAFIEDAIASATVVSSARTLLVCMFYPSGVEIGCDSSGWTTEQPGGTLSFPWSPDADEPTGAYCAYTWREDSGENSTLIGKTCVSVIG